MAKYYAVKNGRSNGIFTSWGECEKQVRGFSGAQYKSFKDMDDAVKYLEEPEAQVETKPVDKHEQDAYDYLAKQFGNVSAETTVVYVDGSYNPETRRYGYGCLIDYGNKKEVLYGSGDCEDQGRNVEGEVAGAVAALKRCRDTGHKSVVMYYDYEGIGSWADSKWRANKTYTKEYAKFVESCRLDGMTISLSHVKGHTGNEGNEYVDKIAKLGCGVALTNSEKAFLSKIRDVPGMPDIDDLNDEPSVDETVDCGIV